MNGLIYKTMQNGYLVSNGKLNIVLLHENLMDIRKTIYGYAERLKNSLVDTRINPLLWKAEVDRLCKLAEYIVSPESKLNIFEYLPLTKTGDFPKNQNILIATSKQGYGISYAGASSDYPVSQKLQIRLIPAYASDMDFIYDRRMNDTVIMKVDLFDAIRKQEPIFDENGKPHKVIVTRATYLKDAEILPGRVYEEKTGTQYLCITGCKFKANYLDNGQVRWGYDLGDPCMHTYIRWSKVLEKALGNDTSFNNIIRVMAARDKTSSIRDRLSIRENPRKFVKEVKVLFNSNTIRPESVIGAKYKDYNGYHQYEYKII